ncbi:beta-L-arabinofuranosidase domain-containing protein [Sphingomonas sp. ATCC 31555]|uniref:beta-L-arabinofuranosidase domain-containing protein n=1 Tax=Sphingomonas sp. ATCC 31555 TaxID=194867 RepID=UPI000474A852|nr:beta-L-arabinofuranosidase domain-containing protein [Sphingomonas sp. ATCC 31555]
MRGTRRELLATAGGALLAASPRVGLAQAARTARLPTKLAPLPLPALRLRPSDYANAVAANHRYLLLLSPDRLLHNFHKYAGMTPKAPIYGGWESDKIAGHTLGHYLTALVLTWQQTGDPEMRRRADYIVAELAAAQAKRGTGYVGALGRRGADGKIVDGETIFREIMRGEIKSTGFDLNGSWSPLYTVHKLFAGLLDVHAGWDSPQALQVTLGLAGYFERVFAALDDERMQQVLGCEYGGLNESFAELYARTRDPRWMAIAKRLYDNRVLDPLKAGEDKLANVHANTQVPKLIGLARIHELTGDVGDAAAARFFWERVTQHHSYVIGGNADREYFAAPDSIALHITDQTCEHCNTYNMLKLTSHLFAWAPDAALFDFYERAHLNHVMAAQHPKTGAFTYMTPLMTGVPRKFAQPDEEEFWCCIGSGMEIHAKHGEAAFWEGEGMFLVNLYVPAEVTWKARGARLVLDTSYPIGGTATVTMAALARPGRFALALRVPGWARGRAVVTVNGKPAGAAFDKGYAIVERAWKAGDALAITLPMEPRLEATPGDASVVAVLRGPLVMAGDLGAASDPWEGADPAMVGQDLLAGFRVDAEPATYRTAGVVRPGDLRFVPFYRQYDRRSAVYFKRFGEGEWRAEQAAYFAEQARLREVQARAVDVMHLGEMQPERDHDLRTGGASFPVAYRGRQGRDARSGGWFDFTMKTREGPLVLQATYWGGERDRDFDILVDDVKIATQHLGEKDRPGKFFDVEYPLPEVLTKGKKAMRVRFVPHDRNTAGPVFGVVLFTPRTSA